MKIVNTSSIEEFITNEKLLSCYSERILLAIYELLQDKHLGKRIAKMLLDKDLITYTVMTENLVGPWQGYTQNYLQIELL
jgi:hypothetical protein